MPKPDRLWDGFDQVLIGLGYEPADVAEQPDVTDQINEYYNHPAETETDDA